MNDTSPPPKKTKWSRQSKINVYIVGSLLLGGLVGFFLKSGTSTGPSALQVALVSFGLIVSVAATVHYTKLLDELARHTHEVAFYWSGILSLAICFVPFALLIGFPNFQLPSLENLLGTKTHAFAAGMGVAIGILLATYVAIWAQIWLKRK